MARVKNVDAYCDFCGAVTKLELTGEHLLSSEESKRWAKCKKCKQTMLIDLNSLVKETKPDFDAIAQQDVRKYSPSSAFEVGESIYHEAWDDFGVVRSKEVLSDGKNSILVEFQKNGKKKLLVTKNPVSKEVN